MQIDVVGKLGDNIITTTLADVMSNRDEWMDWGHFHTLGTTTYMMDPFSYAKLAEAQRPFMARTFAPIYGAVSQALEAHFKLEVVQHPGGACPGFHIFRKSNVSPQVHLDIPFTKVLWPEPFVEPFTFTVPLLLPKAGAGLDIWNGVPPHLAIDTAPDQHVQYEVGNVYVHNGLTTHCISTKYEMDDSDLRITLQGHGARLVYSNQLAVLF